MAHTGLDTPSKEIPKHVLEAKPGPEAITFSPDGRLLAACGLAGPIGVWRVSTGRRLTVYQDKYLSARAVAFSPNSRLLAAAMTDGTVRLFETDTWRQIATCRRHEQEIYALDFSADGKYLVSGCGPGGEAKVWNTANWRLVHSFEQMSASRSLSFSPDGNLLAVPSGDFLSIYEVGTWHLAKKLFSSRLVEEGDKAIEVNPSFRTT